MRSWFQVALLALGLCSATALAGPDSFDVGSGRDGPLTVTAAGTVINRHARVTGPIAPGDNVLLVAGTEGFGAGDLVMVLQVTGLVPEPLPGLTGPVELSRDAVGQWELVRLAAVGEGALTVSSPLVHSYAAQVTQVIRVPEYTHVRIQRGASLGAMPWNGGTGGVVAFLATGTVHNEGEITATGAGFRGGRYVPDNSDPVVCSSMDVGARPGAQKGEGVAVTQYGPTKTGRERVSNGGGGGVCPMAGGGGGGNGGAGGQGGGVADVGASARDMGGQGGTKLVYSLRDHLSFGGGGGSGHGEDWSGPDGGAGGGAIFIRASRLTGPGFIAADGEAGGSSSMGGAGGGGAGGSISLRLSGDAVCGGVSARGGVGGDASELTFQAGEGGGGGGGRVLFQAGPLSGCTASVAAGSNGSRTFSHTGRLAYPDDGVIEAPTVDFALEANKAFVLSPDDKSTVSNVGGPPIEVCLTGADGKCSGGPYDYVLFINGESHVIPTKTSPSTYTPSPPLPSGSYTVYVEVKPSPGVTNRSSEINFTVDADPPDTYIGGTKPPEKTLERTARFSFDSTGGGVRFECRLTDLGELWHNCTSIIEYGDLGIGDHTFFVRAIDSVGNKDATPAEYTWTVHSLDTAIVSAPPSDTKSRTAEFTFSSIMAKSYECELDAPGSPPGPGHAFKGCKGPNSMSYEGLADGTYTFSVRAVYSPGVVDLTPAKHTWTVDNVPPGDTVISSAPDAKTTLSDARFVFSAVGGSKYECALNKPGISPSFTGCTSPMLYAALADGSYTFSVRALDAAGNVGNIASHTWTLDATKPVVAVLFPRNEDMVSTQTPTIIGKVDDPSSTVQVFVDGVLVREVTAEADGDWSWEVATKLINGPHTVYARATNIFGTEGDPSASILFTVDTEPPDTEIISAPPKSSNSRLAAFEFGSPSGATEFECRLDSARSYTACEATYVVAKLVDGEHTLLVRARDGAGNVDSTPAIYQWTVVILPPPFPEVVEPAAGATVNTATPAITGRAVPRGTVTIYIDDKKSGVAQADESGNWTFRPPTPLQAGEHTLTTEATDEAGNTSAQRSDERVFSIVISVGEARAIGGGLSCASSGAHPASSWGLLGSGLWLAWYRRRSTAAPDLRGRRSKVSGA